MEIISQECQCYVLHHIFRFSLGIFMKKRKEVRKLLVGLTELLMGPKELLVGLREFLVGLMLSCKNFVVQTNLLKSIN